MRPAVAYLEHRLPQGSGFPLSLYEAAIEGFHEGSGARVMDVPGAHNKRPGAGVKNTASQSHEFIPSGKRVQAGRTTAECDQISRHPQFVQVVEVQVSVSKPDGGEHRVVLAKVSVAGDMDYAGGATARLQHLMIGLRTDIDFGIAEDVPQGLDLLHDR